jgi:hypothetical protein
VGVLTKNILNKLALMGQRPPDLALPGRPALADFTLRDLHHLVCLGFIPSVEASAADIVPSCLVQSE